MAHESRTPTSNATPWWYRGSDLDTERPLERAKGEDVITWSIQTMNPPMLPDLCSVAEQLAQLSQDRVN